MMGTASTGGAARLPRPPRPSSTISAPSSSSRDSIPARCTCLILLARRRHRRRTGQPSTMPASTASPRMVLLGIALWACVYAGGLHATMAGVILAVFIPMCPPPDLIALRAQASAILIAEASRGNEPLRHGPSLPSLRALDAIHGPRSTSPADRLLRTPARDRAGHPFRPCSLSPTPALHSPPERFSAMSRSCSRSWSAWRSASHWGWSSASALAVKLGLAVKPAEYSWRQLAGAGALAGIGFTMSLFIAGQTFHVEAELTAAKIAIFAVSILSAVAGTVILWICRNAG